MSKKFSIEQMRAFVHGIASAVVPGSKLVLDVRCTGVKNMFRAHAALDGMEFVLSFGACACAKPLSAWSLWEANQIHMPGLSKVFAAKWPKFMMRPCTISWGDFIALGLDEDAAVEAVFNDMRKRANDVLRGLVQSGGTAALFALYDECASLQQSGACMLQSAPRIDFSSFDELLVLVDTCA